MKAIPVELKNTNLLFSDYLENKEEVRKFFPGHFSEDFQDLFDQMNTSSLDRKALVAQLLMDHQRRDAPDPVMLNIHLLKDNHTFAVVTGQQAGIFTGPMYTIYKTFTAIKYAEELSARYPNYNFVPVFWLEVDDHDFEEIRRFHYFDEKNQLRGFEVEENPDEYRKPVWQRKISETMYREQEALRDHSPNTEFRDEILELFFACYQKGESLDNAFACLLQTLFGQFGLIVFNPSRPEFKTMAAPVYKKALLECEGIADQFRENNVALERSGYSHQISLQSNQTFLFLLDDESHRCRVDRNDGRYFIRFEDKTTRFSVDEMMNLLAESPEKFSANVALRPVIQDSLLPTVAYVAGPSEIAYFAQILPLYTCFDLPRPVIIPRHRLTLLEPRDQKIVDKFELDLAAVLNNPQQAKKRFVRENLKAAAQPTLEELRETVDEKLTELQPLLKQTDPTLLKPLEKTRHNVGRALQQLSDRYLKAVENRNATQMRQIESLILHLYPGGHPQERVLNISYYLMKYGRDFLEELYRALPTDSTRHLLVKL